MELARGDERFVFLLDFAFTYELPPPSLILDRLLPVQGLRDAILKLRDSETERILCHLDCGQTQTGDGDGGFMECLMGN